MNVYVQATIVIFTAPLLALCITIFIDWTLGNDI